MKRALVLAVLLAVVVWRCTSHQAPTSRPVGEESSQAEVIDVDSCREAEVVGERAAEAAGAVGVKKGWMTEWARDVSRRFWDQAHKQSCPDKG